jgi:hypothetical protein
MPECCIEKKMKSERIEIGKTNRMLPSLKILTIGVLFHSVAAESAVLRLTG